MKKEDKGTIKNLVFKFILVLALALTTTVNATTNKDLLTPKNAFNTVVYNPNEWDVFKNRTKEEIGLRYDSVKLQGPTYVDGDRTTYYEDAPIAPLKPTGEGIYYGGIVSQDTINVMTAEANYYRWLMGYSELRSVATNSEQLQKEALARRYNIGHYLNDDNRPSDFPIEQWNETKTFTHNILAWGYTPRGAIAGWISEGYDKDTKTFETSSSIGHRVAIIDPTIINLDFGYVGEKSEKQMTTAEEYLGEVSIGKLYKDSSANSDVAFGAFPVPGYMPMNNINAYESTWSIAFNPSKIKVNNQSDVTVKVTNLDNNDSYECKIANGNLEYYDTKYYVPYLNYIQPNYKYGDKYKIEVTGLTDTLTGAPAKIEYETELFDVRDYTPANVTEVIIKKDFLNLYPNTSSAERLEDIAKILPKEAVVKTDRNQTINVELDEWVADKTNKRFITKVKDNQLSSYINDSNNLLNNVIQEYNDQFYIGGNLTVSNNNPHENDIGTITLTRIYFNNVSESNVKDVGIYQIKNNDAVIRYNKSSDNLNMSEENKYIFNIDKFTSNDSGTWIGTYTIYSNLFIAGVEDVNVVTKEPEKEDPKYTVPTGLTANYKDTLSSIILPAGFTWKDDTLSVGDVGEKDFYVTYTPDDTERYNIVENIKVKVTVKKINPEYEIPTNLEATYGDKLSKMILPEGFTWDNDTLSVGNKGTNKFKVTYTPADTKNYNTINNIEVEVTVSEKEIEIPTLEKSEFTYNFEEQEVKVNSIDSKLITVSGTTKATNANTYNVKVALKDKTNYIWSNGSNDDVTLNWNINKINKITVKIKGNILNVIYDGEEKTVEGYTYESSNSSYTDKYFTFTGNKKVSGTNIDTYYMGLTADKFTNTNSNIEQVEFIVTDGYLKISDKNHLNISGLTYKTKVYDGQKVTPEGQLKVESNIVPVSELEVHYYKSINGTYTEVSEEETNKAGLYQVTYKIPDTNKLYSGSVTYDYEIKRKVVNKPTLVNSSYTYNKQEQEIKLNNYDSNLMTISGSTKEINANTYNLLVALKDKENYSWNNNSNDDLSLSWTINKSSNIKVYIYGNIKRIIYDGEEKTINGYSHTSSSEIYTEDDFEFIGDSSVTGKELGIYNMNLKQSDFRNKNNNFENVEFIITDGYLEICEKEVLDITGLIYNNKPYTGSEYIPDGKLIITNEGLNLDDLDVMYEGIGETTYNSRVAPTKVGTYKVTYKVPDNNELYIGSTTYTFKITKANPTFNIPEGLVAERNTELANVLLPDGFVWKQNEILTPGFNKYIAVYTPTDTENYNIIDNVEIDVNVLDYRIDDELEYIIGVNKKLSFSIKAENVNIESILINNEELSQDDYIVEDKTITISEEYVDKLKIGTYYIEVVLDDGEIISKQFTKREVVVEELNNPNTNDNLLISIYLLITSLIAILLMKVNSKRYN